MDRIIDAGGNTVGLVLGSREALHVLQFVDDNLNDYTCKEMEAFHKELQALVKGSYGKY